MWFTDDIWEISERCWKPQPSDRISAETVLLDLERHPPLGPPSNVNRGVEIDGNDRSDATSGDSKYVFSVLPHTRLTVRPLTAHSDDELPDPTRTGDPREG